MDYITAPGNCERRRSAPAPIRDSVPHRCSGSYCPYISRLPAWLRRYIWLIQVLARLCFGFSKATIAAIVPIVLITSWAIQRSKGIPEHSLTSQFHSRCPPMWRYYPNYELALGMPERLYPTLAQPDRVVDRYYKQALKCWHPDKINMHPGLRGTAKGKATMRNILALLEDSREKLKAGTGWPRALKNNTRFLGTSFEPVYHSKYWNTTLTTPLALYNVSQPCKLMDAWHLALLGNHITPTIEAELRTYRPCRLYLVYQRYHFAFDNRPPKTHFFWHLGELGWNLWDLFFYAVGTGGRGEYYGGMIYLLSAEEKRNLVASGWYKLDDFEEWGEDDLFYDII